MRAKVRTILGMIPLNLTRFILLIALAAGGLTAYWLLTRKPESPRRLLPLEAVQGDLLPGLVAIGMDTRHSVSFLSPIPGFYLEAHESIHPSLSRDFAVEWTGLLSVLEAGDYSIQSGEAKVFLQDWEIAEKPVRLSVGRYPIRIRYRRPEGVAQVRLQWSAPHFPPEPIPSSAFSHFSSESLRPQDALSATGRFLFQEYGCVNCHTANSPSLEGRRGPDLSDVGSRAARSWIYHWLENPGKFRSGARMPAMLTAGQRLDVAAYLSSRSTPETAAAGTRQNPDRIRLGRHLYGSLGCAACHQMEDLELNGMGSKSRLIPLARYLKDPARVDSSGRMPSLMLSDEEALSLAAYLIDSKNPVFENSPPGGHPVRGKELVQSQGCLSCHDLRDPGPLGNNLQAPPLEKLAAAGGCLSGSAIEGLPHYDLPEEERRALQAFIKSHRQHPDASPAPLYAFYQKVEQLRCTACHAFDHLGPAVQLPQTAPALTAAGGKLQTAWIEQVLSHQKRIRSWLEIRMPHYDSRQVATLAEGFAKAAGLEPASGTSPPVVTSGRQARGHSLLGNKAEEGGLACLRCHDWGEYRAQGEPGPQLINATERLRYDWFHRFMLNPARILSGTSMPDFFLAENTDEEEEDVHSLWAALSLGADMPLPDGLTATGISLAEARPAPGDKPLVLRTYMPGATPAAIAVGAPGGISYCFDTGECRLRYAWQGGFIDLAELLQVKVAQDGFSPQARLIGEIFYRSESFPLRVGSPAQVPETRFRGYGIVDDYPEFHYQVEGIRVREWILPLEEKIGIRRRFTLDAVDQPMWLVSSQGENTVVTSTLGTLESGRIRIPEGSRIQFEVIVERRANE